MGWPLAKLDSTDAFRIKLNKADTLTVIGEPVDFETTTIKIEAGWNWISFLPPVGLELNEALSGITATSDFIIKSQTNFAQYVEFQGWIGSLDFLRPNQGYLIFSDKTAVLKYPVNNANGRVSIPEEQEVELPNGWSLDATAFEYNSNQIFKVLGLDIKSGDFIGLFGEDNQLYGWGEAKYIEFMDAHYFFVTSYGNMVNQDLEVRLFTSDKEISTDVSVNVEAEQLNGSVNEPLIIDLNSTVLSIESELLSKVFLYPNPFSEYATLSLDLAKNSNTKVTLHNLTGQLVSVVLDDVLQAGSHKLNIHRKSKGKQLMSGVYIVRIGIDDLVITKKLIIK